MTISASHNQLAMDFDPRRYPHKPGHRGVDTSRQAAEIIAPHVNRLEQVVIDALNDHGPLTSEEIAQVTGEDFDSIQPRTSELRAKGIIEDSAHRRKNRRGRNVIIWRLKNSP